MAGIERLHPHLQHAITHDLGWRSLHPVQELTIDAVLDGCNSVVLAPTAGGKTEACIFPVLSQILTDETVPIAALYVCPIRALLNNLEPRIEHYARMVGLDAFKWHGDVASTKKIRFRRDPAHILLTTPESLEVLLILHGPEAATLFKNLRVVIVDEVHAFAADDRGAHLASVLERLSRFCGRDIQRIGLSATVGNPQVIGQWLQGSSDRPFRLVDPIRQKPERELRVDSCDDIAGAAPEIARLAQGRKSLVFVESRSKAERVAHAMADSGAEVFVHHSSISRADRALAEQQFSGGTNTTLVCTSTMELGIDVGDLDQVIQVDAPSSVASFLQRIGRTGRRPGRPQNCSFFCLSPESLLQAVALLRLAERGSVEDVRPASHAMHILAHQIMALLLQEEGISRHRLLAWVNSAYPFSSVREEHLQELVGTMLERGILHESEGRLSLGQRGEQLYGRKNFFDLYGVFTTPPVMRVIDGKEEVGYVQAQFVVMHDRDKGPLTFRLAGRAWQVVQIEWSKAILRVRPSDDPARVPNWLGLPMVLSATLCQAMKEVLVQPGPEDAWLTPRAAKELAALREGYTSLLEPGSAPVEEQGDGAQWHTFAGGAVNRLLAAALGDRTNKEWVVGNLSVRCKDVTLSHAMEAVGGLLSLDWDQLAAAAARRMARGMISKFQPCLPESAEDRLLAERLLDLPGTLRFLGSIKVNGKRLLDRPAGLRLVDAHADQPVAIELTIPAVAAGTKTFALHNEVCWVDTPAALRAMCDELRTAKAIGLDVETSLDFATLCLVQIANGERTYVVDPFGVGTLTPLVAVMKAPVPVKVIHNARFERRVLAAYGVELDGVFDTMTASRKLRGLDALGGHSLAMVCERELGVGLDKSAQTSNWSRRPLDANQIRYAALDAEVLIALYDRFAQQLEATDFPLWASSS